jgi:RecB family exonuclease
MTSETYVNSHPGLAHKQILTQEDFDRIRQLKARQAVAPAVAKRKLAIARAEEDVLDETSILPETKKRKQARVAARS